MLEELVSAALSSLDIDDDTAEYIRGMAADPDVVVEDLKAMLLENGVTDDILNYLGNGRRDDNVVSLRQIDKVKIGDDRKSVGGECECEKEGTFPPAPPRNIISTITSAVPETSEQGDLSEFNAALDDMDDLASVWTSFKAGSDSSDTWGGRGRGGRGIRRHYQCNSTNNLNIHIHNLQLAFAGKELIANSELQLTNGRKYALLGRNGSGKSTLLKRIATKSLVGFPLHIDVAYLSQEPKPPKGEAGSRSALDTLLTGVVAKRAHELQEELGEIEIAIAEAGGIDSNDDVSSAFLLERLEETEVELATFTDREGAEMCSKILTELGFSREKMEAPVATLSGGWSMRVQLAAALISKSDLLLLDEPTNHLDLRAVLALERRLAETNVTMLIVSHDRAFVEAVATDIICLGEQQLIPFAGGFHEFEQRNEEKAAAHGHRMDARVRQEERAQKSSEKMMRKSKQKKGTNDNMARAAKQKQAKIERIGLYRDDGKAYKTRSLKKLDEKFLLLPEKVTALKAEKGERFRFPSPTVDKGSSLVTLDDVSIFRGNDQILKFVNLFIEAGTRAAIVGDNGAGKSTLLEAIAGEDFELTGGGVTSTGSITRHNRTKIAVVSQHHADALLSQRISVDESAVQMFARKFSSDELSVRATLGKFGIVGATATQPLKSLSGGQVS